MANRTSSSQKRRRKGLRLRPAVTLPIEIYSNKRIREFDAAEAELEKVIRRKRDPRSAR